VFSSSSDRDISRHLLQVDLFYTKLEKGILKELTDILVREAPCLTAILSIIFVRIHTHSYTTVTCYVTAHSAFDLFSSYSQLT
jgi:hypothetical protein